MNFEQAIEALKEGKKVARKEWNEEKVWIVLTPPLDLLPCNTQDPFEKVNDHIEEDAPLDSQPYISLLTVTKQWQPGWAASQADILSEWQLVI